MWIQELISHFVCGARVDGRDKLSIIRRYYPSDVRMEYMGGWCRHRSDIFASQSVSENTTADVVPRWPCRLVVVSEHGVPSESGRE